MLLLQLHHKIYLWLADNGHQWIQLILKNLSIQLMSKLPIQIMKLLKMSMNFFNIHNKTMNVYLIKSLFLISSQAQRMIIVNSVTSGGKLIILKFKSMLRLQLEKKAFEIFHRIRIHLTQIKIILWKYPISRISSALYSLKLIDFQSWIRRID